MHVSSYLKRRDRHYQDLLIELGDALGGEAAAAVIRRGLEVTNEVGSCPR